MIKLFEEFVKTELLTESPRPLNAGEDGVIVFDIDDTLLKVNSSDFFIYKKVDGKEIALTTDEFAKDPDTADPVKLRTMYDYRDCANPIKGMTQNNKS